MRFRRVLPASLLAFVPAIAAAQRTLTVELGTRQSILEIGENVVTFLARSIGIVCAALVILGALFIVASRGEDPLKSRGKDLVLYSLIGLAVVLGSAGILQMVFYILYTT